MFCSARTHDGLQALLCVFRRGAGDSVTEQFTSLSDAARRDCINYAKANGVMGLLAARLRELSVQECMPAWLKEPLAVWWEHAVSQHSEKVMNRNDVLRALEESEIRCLVLKGAALSYVLYQNPEVRPARDLDVLVSSPDLRAAKAALESIGFTAIGPMAKGAQHLPRLVRRKNESEQVFAVDVHDRLLPRAVYGIRVGAMDGLWERSVLVDTPSGSFKTLSRKDHVIHMHLHLFHHAFYNFRLMHLLDLTTAIRAWPDVDFALVAEALDNVGLERFRRELWCWIEAFFGDRLPGSSDGIGSIEIARWLLRHGSLPIFAGVRFASTPLDCFKNGIWECRRYLFRSLGVPRWGLLSLGRS